VFKCVLWVDEGVVVESDECVGVEFDSLDCVWVV
jgi:hypothetical protein